MDWNDQKYCEIWRHEWEVIQNRYLEANDRPERVDLRSYARQGLDIVPTVHEGAAVRQMEKRGIQTNIGNLNREIRAANSLMQSIRQLIQNLKGWITELVEKRKELLAQKAAEEATLLPNLLMKYMEIRKVERKDWTRAGQNRGTSQDLKAVSEALSYLRQKGLSTVEDLEAFLESSGKSAADYISCIQPISGEKPIDVQRSVQQQESAAPDAHLTGEHISTPRGSFHVADMTREQMEAAGYGFHHSTDDGKYLIMGNGTQAFAIAAEQREQENYMRTAELSTEQNYNMIDGQINNTPSVDELEEKAKRGEAISLSALAAAVKAEDGRTPQRDPDGKKPSIRAQLKADRAQSCKPQQREKEQEAKRSIRQALEME